MTENLKLILTGINKWMFFGWNYQTVSYTLLRNGEKVYIPEFIREVKWTCPIEHMISKWNVATSSKNPDAYMPRFYAELDNNNRILLLEWVIQNYNGESPLF